MLCGILLASKVWDDNTPWNIEFALILPEFSVKSINSLERTFVEKVRFYLLFCTNELFLKFFFRSNLAAYLLTLIIVAHFGTTLFSFLSPCWDTTPTTHTQMQWNLYISSKEYVRSVLPLEAIMFFHIHCVTEYFTNFNIFSF